MSAGEGVAVSGANEPGKYTLLRLVTGRDVPSGVSCGGTRSWWRRPVPACVLRWRQGVRRVG